MEPMLAVAREFAGLPHRCEFIRQINGVDFINDSKGTNVGAAVAAVESLVPTTGKIVLIAGGEGKGADFRPLAEAASQYCRAVILIGRDADAIDAALDEEVERYRADSLEQAVREASQLAHHGDRVLLSPACASFDMFSSYSDRGDQFRALVEAL